MKTENKIIGTGLVPLLIVFSKNSFGIGFAGFYKGIGGIRYFLGFDVYPNPVEEKSYKFEVSIFFYRFEIGFFRVKRIRKIFEHYI